MQQKPTIYLRNNTLHNPNLENRDCSIERYSHNFPTEGFHRFFLDPYCIDTPQLKSPIMDTNMLGRYTKNREENEIYTWEQVLQNLQNFHCKTFPVVCYPAVSFKDILLVTKAIFQFSGDTSTLLLRKDVEGLASWFDANGVEGQANLLRTNHLLLLIHLENIMAGKLLEFTTQNFLPVMQNAGLYIEPGYTLIPDKNHPDYLFENIMEQDGGFYTAPFAFQHTLGETPNEIFEGGIEYSTAFQFTWPEN